MALEVTRIIQNWLDEEHVKWEASRDVVDWARAYGTDLQRAWAECPRADFLMAIAGACGAEPRIIVHAACSAAREALAFVPAKLALPRKAIHLAETHRRGATLGAGISGGTALADATLALVKKHLADEPRLRKAVQAVTPGALKATVDVILSVLSETVARKHAEGGCEPTSVELLPPEVAGMMDRMLPRALTENPVVLLQKRIAAFYRMVAEAHAIRAAASSLTVASSAEIVYQCQVLVGSIVTRERVTNDKALAGIDEAAAIARRSGARVYSEAALVFVHAAGAFGQADAAGDRAWVTAMATTMTAMLYAAGDAGLDRETSRLHVHLDAYAERTKAAKLSEQAGRVRAVLPFSALNPPQHEADRQVAREAAARRDPLGALRGALTPFAPLARFMGAPDAADAMETALAILNATGPVNKKALARALHTAHEHMGAMFSRHAGEVEGPERDQAHAGMKTAQEAMREMEAVLAELGIDEPN